MNKHQKEIATAIGQHLYEEYEWNIFGSLRCKKCKVTKYTMGEGKFCAKCGAKLEAIPDEQVCKELYAAYLKGKEVETNGP